MFKMLRTRKGQSTLEYLVLVAMVIAILILFLNPTNGVFSRAYNATLSRGTDGMEDMANRLASSRPRGNATP